MVDNGALSVINCVNRCTAFQFANRVWGYAVLYKRSSSGLCIPGLSASAAGLIDTTAEADRFGMHRLDGTMSVAMSVECLLLVPLIRASLTSIRDKAQAAGESQKDASQRVSDMCVSDMCVSDMCVSDMCVTDKCACVSFRVSNTREALYNRER
eukprot:1161491-Pelagomonas_calceolata.AAC.5